MTTLISYASDNMTISQERLVVSAYKWGIDNVISYNRQHIDKGFYLNNKDILDAERGAGYWLWKPYIINKTINQLSEGDILIYSDAGVAFINDPKCIIDQMDEDIFMFSNGWPHVEWCKGDVLAAILPITNHDIYGYKHIGPDIKQVQASVIFFKVTDKAKAFIKEWLLYCQMPWFIDDSPSVLSNFPTFAEHRHDQAILTCLQIKYGYKTHWWPTIYSEHLPRTDSYPAMFEHHRLRNHEYNNVSV
jgi:hypothetical protein